MDESDEKKISELIAVILKEDDEERRRHLADKIADINPDHPVAKYVKWQSSEDPEATKDTTLLEEAVSSLRPAMKPYSGPSGENPVMYRVYLGMLSDLASFSFINGNKKLAFETAAEYINLDCENDSAVSAVHYASLLERGEYEKLIGIIDADFFETLQGEYCRTIAVLEMEGPGEEAALCLLNAIALAPDIPFYLLGLWSSDFDLENIDEDNAFFVEFISTAPMIHELWSATDERFSFLSLIVFTFGYITGRVAEPEDVKMIEENCRHLGSLEELRESRDIFQAMIAAGQETDVADEKALAMFEEHNFFGFIG